MADTDKHGLNTYCPYLFSFRLSAQNMQSLRNYFTGYLNRLCAGSSIEQDGNSDNTGKLNFIKQNITRIRNYNPPNDIDCNFLILNYDSCYDMKLYFDSTGNFAEGDIYVATRKLDDNSFKRNVVFSLFLLTQQQGITVEFSKKNGMAPLYLESII